MGPGPRWRQLLPDLLLWGLLFSSFTCPWVCTAAGGATSEAQKGRLRKAAAGAEAGDGNAARGPTAGPALRERALFRPGAGLFYKDPPPGHREPSKDRGRTRGHKPGSTAGALGARRGRAPVELHPHRALAGRRLPGVQVVEGTGLDGLLHHGALADGGRRKTSS